MNTEKETPKKTYQQPDFVEYGNLFTITQGGTKPIGDVTPSTGTQGT